MSDIAVIIPVYNCESYLETAISSVLSQAGLDIEIIAVDDGSTDGSLEVLRKFGNRITVIEQENEGACVARNVGVRASTCPFIKFLDADDYLVPGSLQAQLSHAINLTQNEFSYGRVLRKIENDGRLVPHGRRDNKVNNQDDLDELLIDPPPISAMLYPRHLLEALGGLDIRLVKRQDYDLFARALLAGYAPKACKEPIFAYRSHDNTSRISRQSDQKVFLNQLEMFQRQGELLKLAESERDVYYLRIGISKTVWITARNCLRCGHVNVARKMFDLSDLLGGSQGRKGKPLYNILVALFGPLIAESMLEKLKAKRSWL